MNATTAGIVAAAVIVVGLIGWAIMGNSQPTANDMAPATTSTSTNDFTTPIVGDTTMEESALAENPSQNIVETAQAAGSFTTLLQAAQAAGLADALVTQEVTVFAPTDEAFAELPAGTLESLLDNPDQLAEVLKYHVVAGTVPASEVVNLSHADTLQGSQVSITVDSATVMVDEATVVQTDIMASNGIIHVIDTVITP